MEPSTFPPGWYPDPVAGAPAGQHRYFTGTIWTEHVANPNASAPGTARKRRRWVGPTLTAIGLALVVCVGGYFISRPASKSYPEAWDPQVAPIAQKVASLRGLSFDHPVPVRYVPEKKFRRGVGVDESKLSEEERKQIKDLGATLRAFGLIDAKTDLAKSLDTVNQAGVLAYYDPSAEEIVVRSDGPLDLQRKATIADELTHVLQDQHFDLQGLRREAAASKTGSNGALTALVEGDAERIKYRYLASLPKADQDAFDEQEMKQGTSVDQEVADAAEIVKIELERAVRLRPGGAARAHGEGWQRSSRRRAAALDAQRRDLPQPGRRARRPAPGLGVRTEACKGRPSDRGAGHARAVRSVHRARQQARPAAGARRCGRVGGGPGGHLQVSWLGLRQSDDRKRNP